VALYAAPKAPVHFMIGTAGADLSCCHAPTTPGYTEVTIAAYGHARLDANATALRWTFVLADNGTVADEALITKA